MSNEELDAKKVELARQGREQREALFANSDLAFHSYRHLEGRHVVKLFFPLSPSSDDREAWIQGWDSVDVGPY